MIEFRKNHLAHCRFNEDLEKFFENTSKIIDPSRFANDSPLTAFK